MRLAAALAAAACAAARRRRARRRAGAQEPADARRAAAPVQALGAATSSASPRANAKIREEVAKFPGATREAYTKGAGALAGELVRQDAEGQAAQGDRAGRRSTTAAAPCSRRGRASACRGRWRAATTARSGARSTRRTSGSRCSSRSSCRSSTRAGRSGWLHLDVLVLAGFSVSLAYFNAAEVETSVPLVYPLLLYLLARMLVRRACGARGAGRAPRLLVPATWLAVGLVFLVGFRIGLNLTSSNVIDVGYSGVIGADRLADGDPLYGGWPKDNEHGDTYGPFAYVAYLPFEQLLPWSGRVGRPAGGARRGDRSSTCSRSRCLFLLGRRVGGTVAGHRARVRLGGLPVHALRAEHELERRARHAARARRAARRDERAGARGARSRLAGMAKFAPAALAPVLATYGLAGRPWREQLGRLLLFAGAFLLVTVGAPARSASTTCACSGTGRSASRPTATRRSRSGACTSCDGLQRVVQAAGVILALALAVVPRRQDLAGLAALCAAVLIALQLGVGYWFYLYLVWFFPLVMLAVLAPRPPSRPSTS